MGLLDILFPKYCVQCKKIGEYLCSDCFANLSFDTEHLCLVCNEYSLDGFTHPGCQGKFTIDGAFCGLLYKNAMKTLIFRCKYPPYLADLGTFLTQLMHEGLIQQESFISLLQTYQPALIPIPLSTKRLRKRGYNQAEILAKGLAKMYNLSVLNCLQRIKDTKPQFGLKKEERKKNIKGAFAMKQSFQKSSANSCAFLIDDLLTTGTTLSEAAAVLKRNGFSYVWAICLARDK